MTGQKQRKSGSQPRARRPDFPLGNYAMAQKTAQADEAATITVVLPSLPTVLTMIRPITLMAPYPGAYKMCSVDTIGFPEESSSRLGGPLF
jgi:hypothetical protein